MASLKFVDFQKENDPPVVVLVDLGFNFEQFNLCNF